MNLQDKLTVFIISSGEVTLSDCLYAINHQQKCSFRICHIKDVSPMNAAFQQMIDRCETEFFIQVDADMILKPLTVATLYNSIIACSEKTALFCGYLWGDLEEQPIQGVKIYRHSIVKQFPYQDSTSCEWNQLERIIAAGFDVVVQHPIPSAQKDCLGDHLSLQTPERAFRRWQRLMIKSRKMPIMRFFDRFLPRIEARSKAGSEVHKAALWGAISGLTMPLPENDSEDDASKPCEDFKRVNSYLGCGPRELVLYTTYKCNHKCKFCLRTKKGAPVAGDVSVDLVNFTFDQYPTLSSVCIAGFGEPLMHEDIDDIVRVCKHRAKYVGLISNGSLINKVGAELIADWNLTYFSVSLNAICKEDHEKITGGDTWQAVIDGAIALLRKGVNVGLSYVATKQNSCELYSLLDLADMFGFSYVNIVNLLPHNGSNDEHFTSSVITENDDEALAYIEFAKSHPRANLVNVWPKPISLKNPPPRKCQSPFDMIGIDGNGNISGCRRIMPPKEEYGHIAMPGLWHGDYYKSLRAEICGDKPLRDECKFCFGNWLL